MKTCIIAEKPSVARDIARIVGSKSKTRRLSYRKQLHRNMGIWTSRNVGDACRIWFRAIQR